MDYEYLWAENSGGRPLFLTYFYYNLYSFVDMIRQGGLMAANYGGEDQLAMVAP